MYLEIQKMYQFIIKSWETRGKEILLNFCYQIDSVMQYHGFSPIVFTSIFFALYIPICRKSYLILLNSQVAY